MSSTAILVLMFGGLTLFMLTGLPIAFVLGGLSLLFTVLFWNPQAVVILVLQIFDTMKSEALLAIPLYILMAAILSRSGVIEKLYRAMEPLVRPGARRARGRHRRDLRHHGGDDGRRRRRGDGDGHPRPAGDAAPPLQPGGSPPGRSAPPARSAS